MKIDPDHWLERDVLRRPFIIGDGPAEPGRNLDRIDVDAGVRELLAFWPDASVETRFVIEYALRRWARGEEDAAERGAIDRKFHGIDFGSWRRVLAVAMASAAVEAQAYHIPKSRKRIPK